MNGSSDPINAIIKEEPLDTFEKPESNTDDNLKTYHHHVIGPFAVNESSYHEEREKYQTGESSRMSDSDVLSVTIESRDGAESTKSHESDPPTFHDDIGTELKYECSICQTKFRSARAFKGHTNAHRYSNEGHATNFRPCSRFTGQYSPKPDQSNGTFECNGCQKIFYSRDTYAMHMMLRAKNEDCSLTKSALTQLNCDLKEEKSERVKMNIEAILSSLGHNTWSAMEMQKMTMRKALDYRVTHEPLQQQHSSGDILACTVCGEVMHSKDSLAMHMLFHARGAGDGNEENLNNNLPMPPLSLPTMREYVNALAIAGNKAQAARNMAVFHQAALNLTTANIGSFESKLPLVSPKQQTYEPLALIKRARWDENENGKRLKNSTELILPKDAGKMSPITPPVANITLRNGFANTPNDASVSDVEESRSDTCSDVQRQGISPICATLVENRPKSLDSAISSTKLAAKGSSRQRRYTSYRNHRIRSLMRKYAKQNSTKRQQPQPQPQPQPQQEIDMPEPVQIRTKELQPLIETNPKIPKELLAAHNTTCYCQYCEIIYLDRTLYQLHMGLHNVNNPWQCNACGKICVNRLEFSSHVLHY